MSETARPTVTSLFEKEKPRTMFDVLVGIKRKNATFTFDEINTLVNENSLDILEKDDQGLTILTYYLTRCVPEQKFVQNFLKKGLKLDEKDNSLKTPLHHYLAECQSVVDEIGAITKGGDPNFTLKDADNRNLFHAACLNENGTTTKLLDSLQKKMSGEDFANSLDNNACSPLHLYLEHCLDPQLDVIEWFIKKNTSCVQLDHKMQRNLLMAYCANAKCDSFSMEIVGYLLNEMKKDPGCKSDPINLEDKDGNTAVMLYTLNNKHVLAENLKMFLEELKADFTHQNRQRQYILHLMGMNNNVVDKGEFTDASLFLFDFIKPFAKK